LKKLKNVVTAVRDGKYITSTNNVGEKRVDNVRTDENLVDPFSKGLTKDKVDNPSVKNLR
jgi:hypothetical protein